MLTFGVGLTRLCYYEALLCFAPYWTVGDWNCVIGLLGSRRWKFR
jgi:hypothetical protein